MTHAELRCDNGVTKRTNSRPKRTKKEPQPRGNSTGELLANQPEWRLYLVMQTLYHVPWTFQKQKKKARPETRPDGPREKKRTNPELSKIVPYLLTRIALKRVHRIHRNNEFADPVSCCFVVFHRTSTFAKVPFYALRYGVPHRRSAIEMRKLSAATAPIIHVTTGTRGPLRSSSRRIATSCLRRTSA